MKTTLWNSPALFIDIQTTGQSLDASMLELGWLLASAHHFDSMKAPEVEAHLIRVKDALPPVVSRLTGISTDDCRTARTESEVWKHFETGLLSKRNLKKTFFVIHYARFELNFVNRAERLHQTQIFPTRGFCTQEIARKLFPNLPSRGLRALAGYVGYPLPEHQRARIHVEATVHIWRFLLKELDAREGIREEAELREWLSITKEHRTGRSFQVQRDKRLSIPDAPGIYRMRSREGRILYVGKATSLRTRVNSYFRHRTKGKLSELLTQVADVEWEETPTALEAALLESAEIKLQDPRYNVVLRTGSRKLCFMDREGGLVVGHPLQKGMLGPFASFHLHEALDLFSRMTTEVQATQFLFPELDEPKRVQTALKSLSNKYGLPIPGDGEGFLTLGYRSLRSLGGKVSKSLLEEQEEAWTDEKVLVSLQRKLARSARVALDARQVLRLSHSVVLWKASPRRWRRLCFERGEVTSAVTFAKKPREESVSSWRVPLVERAQSLTLESYDRLRVLIAELRRLRHRKTPLEIYLSPSVCVRGRWLG